MPRHATNASTFYGPHTIASVGESGVSNAPPLFPAQCGSLATLHQPEDHAACHDVLSSLQTSDGGSIAKICHDTPRTLLRSTTRMRLQSAILELQRIRSPGGSFLPFAPLAQ